MAFDKTAARGPSRTRSAVSKARLEVSLPRPRPSWVPGGLPAPPPRAPCACGVEVGLGGVHPLLLRPRGSQSEGRLPSGAVCVPPPRGPGNNSWGCPAPRPAAGRRGGRARARNRPAHIEASPAAASTLAHLRRAGRGRWRLVLFRLRFVFQVRVFRACFSFV